MQLPDAIWNNRIIWNPGLPFRAFLLHNDFGDLPTYLSFFVREKMAKTMKISDLPNIWSSTVDNFIKTLKAIVKFRLQLITLPININH